MNQPLDSRILTIREQKVLLDADLATIYGVPTKRLNEQVKQNAERFPQDFCFQLTAKEWESLRSQIVTFESEPSEKENDANSRSQIATIKPGRGQHRKYLPYAFTEHGALNHADDIPTS